MGGRLHACVVLKDVRYQCGDILCVGSTRVVCWHVADPPSHLCTCLVSVLRADSSDIFQFAGVTQAILSTTLVFGLNVAMTVLSAYLIDRLGRKSLLMKGSLVMTASLFTLGAVLKLLPVSRSWGNRCPHPTAWI